MNRALKALAGLLAGVLCFLVVGAGVTAALAPRVRLSALVGLPAGLTAGVAAIPLVYYGLTYLEERASPDGPSTRTVRRLRATVAALAGFAGGSALATVVLALSTRSVGLAGAMILGGFPAGVVAAAAAAHYVLRRGQDGTPAPRTG